VNSSISASSAVIPLSVPGNDARHIPATEAPLPLLIWNYACGVLSPSSYDLSEVDYEVGYNQYLDMICRFHSSGGNGS
jgi:hypothetical protein